MKTRSSELFSATELLDPEQYRNDPDSPPAHLPDYVTHLERIVRRAARNGIHELAIGRYARVSDPRPGQRDTTPDQLKDENDEIRRLEKKYGIELPIIDDGEFCEQVSGSEFSKRKRSKLVQVAKLAKVRYGVVVGFDPSRYVRNEDSRKLPTVADCEAIKRLVGNVQLATIKNPIKHEYRSSSTKRGQKLSPKSPGRPKTPHPGDTKRRRMELKLSVIRLLKQGLGYREIGRRLGTDERNVRRWEVRYAKHLR